MVGRRAFVLVVLLGSALAAAGLESSALMLNRCYTDGARETSADAAGCSIFQGPAPLKITHLGPSNVWAGDVFSLGFTVVNEGLVPISFSVVPLVGAPGPCEILSLAPSTGQNRHNHYVVMPKGTTPQSWNMPWLDNAATPEGTDALPIDRIELDLRGKTSEAVTGDCRLGIEAVPDVTLGGVFDKVSYLVPLHVLPLPSLPVTMGAFKGKGGVTVDDEIVRVADAPIKDVTVATVNDKGKVLLLGLIEGYEDGEVDNRDKAVFYHFVSDGQVGEKTVVAEAENNPVYVRSEFALDAGINGNERTYTACYRGEYHDDGIEGPKENCVTLRVKKVQNLDQPKLAVMLRGVPDAADLIHPAGAASWREVIDRAGYALLPWPDAGENGLLYLDREALAQLGLA